MMVNGFHIVAMIAARTVHGETISSRNEDLDDR